jgi:hypothetical protein
MAEAASRIVRFRADLVAGIALAAFAIPGSMAYAGLAGLPPQAGLYAYLVRGAAVRALTSSRHVAVGPTSSISMMVAAALAPLAGDDPVRYGQLAAATALMVAAISPGGVGPAAEPARQLHLRAHPHRLQGGVALSSPASSSPSCSESKRSAAASSPTSPPWPRISAKRTC